MHTITEKKLLMLKPEDIVSNPNNPRENFNQREIELLANSISQNGIIEPLLVAKSNGKKYILISGERRLTAAKTAHLRRVPCVVHKADDITCAIYSITDNMHRENLNFFEESAAISNILQKSCITQNELAIRLGIPKTALNKKLRLLRLSEKLKKRIIDFGLDEKHAQILLKLKESNRELVLEKIIAESLTPEQTQEFIDSLECQTYTTPTAAPKEPRQSVKKAAISDLKLFSNSLSKLLLTLQSAGIEAHSKRQETDKYIEFKVKIIKNHTPDTNYSQLKIC